MLEAWRTNAYAGIYIIFLAAVFAFHLRALEFGINFLQNFLFWGIKQ